MLKDSFRFLNADDLKEWDEFVFRHPQGNIFQTPEMAQVYRRTRNHEPISFAIINNSSDEILAILSAVILKEKGIAGHFSSRSIIQGGPLYVKNEKGLAAVSLLMEEYNKIIEKKALYSEIRPVYDMSDLSSINLSGYVFEDHLNFLIPIDKPEEEICKQIHKTMRKNIKKAYKSGVTVEEINDRKQVSIYYGFLKEVYHKAKVPLADISFFESVYDVMVPKGMAKFHLAKHENTYIGGRLTFFYKDRVYADSVGVPIKYRHLYPNALLNYHIMVHGSKNGYSIFDFGGAGKPGKEYGAREFKSQFGGEMVNYGRYKMVHAPVKFNLVKKGFELYRKIFI